MNNPTIYYRSIPDSHKQDVPSRDSPLETMLTTIRSGYFGREVVQQKGESTFVQNPLGLHLVINAGPKADDFLWDASFTNYDDISGLFTDLRLGNDAGEHYVARVEQFAGRRIKAHYAVTQRFGKVLLGISAPSD